MENNIHELIIIGAGPAGLTAAVYARRAGIEVVLLEASSPGGKMVSTAEIENWPGNKTITGPDLAYQMFDHATSLGAVYTYGVVEKIVPGKPSEVHCADGSVKLAKAVLIATGTVERKLGIPGELEFANRGVSYCAVCDGAFFKEKVVTVIGGGNSALEEALYLTKFATQVNIIIRRDQFRGDKIIQEKLDKNPKINIIKSSIPVRINGEGNVNEIIIENVNTKEQSSVPTSGIFPFIGLDPVTSFITHLDACNEAGYILVDSHMKTKYDGLYAAGDVNQKGLRQVVTATNDGAIAAQAIAEYLDNY